MQVYEELPNGTVEYFSDYNLFGRSVVGAEPAFGGGLGKGPGGPSPLVSFTEWQGAYGWDMHSVYSPELKARLWARSLELELTAGPAADLRFPGIPPEINPAPYQSPPPRMAVYPNVMRLLSQHLLG